MINIANNGCNHNKVIIKICKMMMIFKQQDLEWELLIGLYTQLDNNKLWVFFQRQFKNYCKNMIGDIDIPQ